MGLQLVHTKKVKYVCFQTNRYTETLQGRHGKDESHTDQVNLQTFKLILKTNLIGLRNYF